jgi:hypothetical protein
MRRTWTVLEMSAFVGVINTIIRCAFAMAYISKNRMSWAEALLVRSTTESLVEKRASTCPASSVCATFAQFFLLLPRAASLNREITKSSSTFAGKVVRGMINYVFCVLDAESSMAEATVAIETFHVQPRYAQHCPFERKRLALMNVRHSRSQTVQVDVGGSLAVAFPNNNVDRPQMSLPP